MHSSATEAHTMQFNAITHDGTAIEENVEQAGLVVLRSDWREVSRTSSDSMHYQAISNKYY